MADEEGRQHLGAIRALLPYTSVLALIAIVYVGWVFFSRSRDKRQAAHQAVAEEASADRKIVETLGGGHVKLLSFYGPQAVARGEKAMLCYGVSNAKTIRIDPAVPDVNPSLSRCLPVSPTQDTTYTLTAADADGHTVNGQVAIKVR